MPAPRTTESRGRTVLVIALALLAGVAARVALVAIAPRHAFVGDHVDYVCWGRQAAARGVLDLYTSPPGNCPSFIYIDGSRRFMASGSEQRLNYPPLAAYIFWLDGKLHAVLDPAQNANTVTSRAVYAIPTALAEIVTASGTAALVRLFASPAAAATAFGLTLLAPPLLVDGPFWGQTEAWILAPAVWMVWAMARGRWLLAGALWGVALGLKPSGLLFGPLWAYAFLFRRERTRVVLGGIVALAVLNLAALPFWLSSGSAWLSVTYLENYVYDLHWTSMMAFNVWYIDQLLTERSDSYAPLLGMRRDLWGHVFLALGLLTAFVVARRWERRNPSRAVLGILPLATMVVLAAIALPTRVHSTYSTFTVPFLIATAFLLPATWPSAAVMVVAATLQILSWHWGNLLVVHLMENEHELPAARYAERRAMRARDRPREWALTLVSLGAAASVFAGVASATRERESPESGNHATPAGTAP